MCRLGNVGPDIQIASRKTAINVELGKPKIKENTKIALKDFERVIVCSDNDKLLETLKKKTKDERFLFCDVWDAPSPF